MEKHWQKYLMQGIEKYFKLIVWLKECLNIDNNIGYKRYFNIYRKHHKISEY